MKKNNGCIEEKEDYTLLEIGNHKITVRDLQLEVLTIMDEIHRMNKAQQDLLLPHVESGLIIVIKRNLKN